MTISSQNFLFLLVIILLINIACQREVPEGVAVAKVGKEKILLTEFQQSFVLNPQYAIRTSLRAARESQLDFLVNETFYHLAARGVKLAEDSLVRRRITYIENQETIKAYLHQNFIDKITLSEVEQLQGLVRLDRQVRVQHLYTATLADAESLYQRLRDGENFEILAQEIYRDPGLSASGGDLGFVGFGDLDERLEEKVFSMQLGEISPPVQSAYGYHILRVTDWEPNEQLMNLGSAQRIQLVNEILKARKADRQIREHLGELAQAQQIQVNNRILRLLAEATTRVMGDRYEDPSPFKPSLRTGDLQQIGVGLEELLGETLVRFGKQEMTVADFLERLKEMPPLHRPYLRSQTRLAQSIIDMVRNDLLLQEARREGVDRQRRTWELIQKHVRELVATEFQRRYYSENWKDANSDQWENYHCSLQKVKDQNPVTRYPQNLFSDNLDPDSAFAPPPIPVFVKSRYIW